MATVSSNPSSVPLFVDADCSVRLWTYPPHYAMPGHEHETHGISVVLGGQVGEVVGNCEETGSAFSVVVKPASVVHANRFGPLGAKILSINLSASYSPGDAAADCLLRWRWGHDAMLPLHPDIARILARRATTALDVDALVEACLSVSGDATGEANADSERHPPTWLIQVRDRLHDEYVSPPAATELAAQAGVHRVHLVRTFRRFFGLPPAEYVRRLRVRTATTRLALTTAGIASVALEAGFADQSHLGRQFRRETGFTPAGFRNAVRA